MIPLRLVAADIALRLAFLLIRWIKWAKRVELRLDGFAERQMDLWISAHENRDKSL